ncbi:Uncharacterised protein [Raoultella terrigena]|uniref:Uncharacterized protein n=1 Tax=Raoultella terrigena TaxID=577 RepID=A0A3P8M0Q7_RAOTE|nr:Uncharacterised protein [Raoultella terrigena]
MRQTRRDVRSPQHRRQRRRPVAPGVRPEWPTRDDQFVGAEGRAPLDGPAGYLITQIGSSRRHAVGLSAGLQTPACGLQNPLQPGRRQPGRIGLRGARRNQATLLTAKQRSGEGRHIHGDRSGVGDRARCGCGGDEADVIPGARAGDDQPFGFQKTQRFLGRRDADLLPLSKLAY